MEGCREHKFQANGSGWIGFDKFMGRDLIGAVKVKDKNFA